MGSKAAYGAALAVALNLSIAAVFAKPAISAPNLAILEFGFLDTSGEIQDKRLAHESRLRQLSDDLRDGLSATRKFDIVDIACGDRSCVSGMDADRVLQDAQNSGADYLMRGVVRKMSTLVLSVQIDITDVRKGKVAFARSFSFRGDTDEAWRHASAFIAREISTDFEGRP
ncbi:MAG TPA: DUF2380 domain-containing protein [Ferrovibrio sp.]|jgi:hypothetical protein|uniref:DUF2380 domain-containing protein n=1 Tax=Ferrovibrio sp. TaxID=1917215 RepID=UPI002ED45C76